MSARISVVIPCYNASGLLAETLSSALAQTVPADEIIVIDDGSTDDSADIARSFGSKVRLVQQENAGESVARNRGFELASGEWIALLDADDIWKPTKLEQQLKLATDGVVCVHTAYYKFGDQESLHDCSAVPPHRRYDPVRVSLANFLPPSTTIVRRSVQARFPSWTRYGEDLIFFLDLLREGEFRMVSEPLTGHRVHARAQSAIADRELDWRASVIEWLDRGQHDLSDHQQRQMRRGWDARVVRQASMKAIRGNFTPLRDARRSLGWRGTARAAVPAAAHSLGYRFTS